MRLVVCTLGGDVHPWDLPASRRVTRTWIHGGERSLYELAVGAAALGHDVELRGDISEPDLQELREATGVAPRVGLPSRRPDSDDVLILPAGWTDPFQYARVLLSPARAIVLVMGPPGLFGWSFRGRWSKPDPLTVPLDSVGRAESFQAMAALGLEVWADTPALAAAARRAGVECVDIGHGSPLPVPDPVEKTHDVAVVESNRWASLAREVASKMGGSHLMIDEARHTDLKRQLGRARVLVWTSRVEGRARLPAEARAVGTVPVAWRSNPYAESLEEAKGAVVVDSLEEMPEAVSNLLASPDRLEHLSELGIRTAREEDAWDLFVKRLDEALSHPAAPDVARDTRAAFGDGVAAELQRRDLEAERISQRHLDSVESLRRLKARRSVRAALALARLTRPWFALKERLRRK
jgi:glycosyltransferase involved in cell wall biosynthesis